MIGIELKVELDGNNAVIHRRFVTPLFYIKLKTKTAVFEPLTEPQKEAHIITAGLLAMPLIIIRYGNWCGDYLTASDLGELNKVKRAYRLTYE